MAPMIDAETLDRLRQRLLRQREALTVAAASGREMEQAVELDQTRMGRVSRMDALQGQAMSLELKRRRELELRGIAAALKRMEIEEYGECARCGEPINPRRLELDPAATLCIACAREADHG